MPDRFVLLNVDALKPGQMTRVVVQNQQILVANIDGQYCAADDKCTHEDWPLSDGALKGDCVECPLHGSRFNLKTGEPREEPATATLKTYETDIEQGKVYIIFGK